MVNCRARFSRSERRRLELLIVAASALGVGRGTIAAAQSPAPDTGHRQSTPHGRVLGVYDQASGDPIVGADVTDLLTGDHTLTTATGTVSLWFVRAKGTMVEVRKIGYEPRKAVVDPGDSVPMTVLLQRVAELPTVRSTAKLNIATDEGVRSGFDRRCEAANVTCVREDVLESHPTNTLGDLLVRSQGIVPARGGLRMHSNGTGLCRPTYYVDGFKLELSWRPDRSARRCPRRFRTPSAAIQCLQCREGRGLSAVRTAPAPLRWRRELRRHRDLDQVAVRITRHGTRRTPRPPYTTRPTKSPA